MFCKYLRFISITWFGYWFVEKILSMLSSSWWCTHVPRASANEAYKINWWQEFPILLALNYYTFMCTGNFYKYEHIYTYRKKWFQDILESKKIMQLVWTAVAGLILNMELNMIFILFMEFACIRHSWTLQQKNLTVC